MCTENAKQTIVSGGVSPSDNNNYAKLGDALNCITLVLTIGVFVGVALFADDPNQTFFSKTWAEAGFCMSDTNVPYWTSHDLSLYADVVMFLVLIGLAYNWHREPFMQGLHSKKGFRLAFSILAHGLAHGGLAHASRTIIQQGDKSDIATMDTIRIKVISSLVMMVLFWFPMLSACMFDKSVRLVATTSLFCQLGMIVVPSRFHFSYVQAALMTAACVNDLLLPKEQKGREYATFVSIVCIPVALTGWVECFLCGDLYKSLGGHAVYDFTIAVSQTIFYIEAYLHGRRAATMMKSKAKLE